MRHRHKLLALLPIALISIGAVASTAQSDGMASEFVGFEVLEGPPPSVKIVKTKVDGVSGTTKQTFETESMKMTCDEASFADTLETGLSPTLSLTVEYDACHVFIEAIEKKFPATVKVNDKCRLGLGQPFEEEEDAFSGGAGLSCPNAGERVLEVEVFAFGDTEIHSQLACTVTVFPDTKISSNVKYSNDTGEIPWHISAMLELSKVPYEMHGEACLEPVGKVIVAGVYKGSMTLKGTNGAGEPIDFILQS